MVLWGRKQTEYMLTKGEKGGEEEPFSLPWINIPREITQSGWYNTSSKLISDVSADILLLCIIQEFRHGSQQV